MLHCPPAYAYTHEPCYPLWAKVMMLLQKINAFLENNSITGLLKAILLTQ
jgi:hypothetical protein